MIPFKKTTQSDLNFHYTRGSTPKRVTSGGAHLRGLAPAQHSSEETSQGWRAAGDTSDSRWKGNGKSVVHDDSNTVLHVSYEIELQSSRKCLIPNTSFHITMNVG